MAYHEPSPAIHAESDWQKRLAGQAPPALVSISTWAAAYATEKGRTLMRTPAVMALVLAVLTTCRDGLPPDPSAAPARPPPALPSAPAAPATAAASAPATTAAPEASANTWEVYRNKDHGFELRHPSSLYAKHGAQQIFLAKKAASAAEKLDSSDNLVEIRINNSVHRFDDYYNASDNTVVGKYGDLKLRGRMVGRYKAVEYGYHEKSKDKEIAEQEEAMRKGSSVGMIYFPRGLMVNRNGIIIEVSTDSYRGEFKETFDQIISSFKFSQP